MAFSARFFSSITGFAAEWPFRVPAPKAFSGGLDVEAVGLVLQKGLAASLSQSTAMFRKLFSMVFPSMFRQSRVEIAALRTWNWEADLRRFIKDRRADATTGLVAGVLLQSK